MTEQNIFDNKHVTSNSAQIAVLKKHFPNCFDKEGNFLIDSFKEIIKSDHINTSHEGYKLDWLGKSYARLLANEKPRTLIRPNKGHNLKEQNKNSNNLLIKGDNLEVLKHLKNAYTESVKVIYIDPPYNTGLDGFVYKDDRRFSKEELANLANLSEEEAQRILDFTDKGSNSHSAWLTFIYPRLYVARELLREDGVIFISIDDNEQAQLKLLCDEVFGEENFIESIIWRKKSGGGQQDDYLVTEHDYILCYSKKKENFSIVEKTIKRTNDGYKLWDEVEGKKYKLTKLAKWGSSAHREDRPTMYFPIIDPDGNKNYPIAPDGREGRWRLGKASMDHLIRESKIEFKKENDEWIAYEKDYEPTEEKIKVLKERSIFYDLVENTSGANELTDIFGVKDLFQNPKPSDLIEHLLHLTISPRKNDIVMDFFAGSGTTAHSVMNLCTRNKEKYTQTSYILAQLPEELNPQKKESKIAYQYCVDNNLEPTIFSITKARIEKAAAKIQAENPGYKGDLGFKIFETTPLPENYDAEIDKLTPETQTKIWDGSNADESQLEAILTTWTLYDRILLTTTIEPVMFDDYKAYYGIGKESNTLYLMYKGFNIGHIKQIIDKLENDKEFTPKKIVIYGHNFESKTQRELSEALNSFRNKKQLEIDIIIRY